MATRKFSDIDLSFKPHPTTGDLVAKYDDAAIKNSIKNLIMTKHFERPFRSDLGSSVNSLLFETPHPGTIVLLKEEITNTIINYEPRAVPLQVAVNFSPDNHTLNIAIVFKIVNTNQPLTLQFTLDRKR